MPGTCISNLSEQRTPTKCMGFQIIATPAVSPNQPTNCGCNRPRCGIIREFTDTLGTDKGEYYTPEEQTINASVSSQQCNAQACFIIPSSVMRRRKMQQVLSASGKQKCYTERRVQTTPPVGFRSCECNLPVGFRSCKCNLPVKESTEIEDPARPKVINVKLHLKLIPEQPKVPIRKAIEKRGGPCGWDCSRFGPMFEQMLGVLKDIDKGVHDLKNNQTTFFKACKTKQPTAEAEKERTRKKEKRTAKMKKSLSHLKFKKKPKKNKKDKKSGKNSKVEEQDDEGGSSNGQSQTESSEQSDEEFETEDKRTQTTAKKSTKKKTKWPKSKSKKNDDFSHLETEQRQSGGSDYSFKDSSKTVQLKIPPRKPKNRRKNCLWRKMSKTLSTDCFNVLKRKKFNKNVDFADDEDQKVVSSWTKCKDNTTQYSKQPIHSSIGGIGLQTDFIKNKSKRNFMTSTTSLGMDSSVPSVLIRTHNLEEESPSLLDVDSIIPLHGSIPTRNASEQSDLQFETVLSDTPHIFSSIISANATSNSDTIPPAPNPSRVDTKESKNESKKKKKKDASARKSKQNKSENRLSAGYEPSSLVKAISTDNSNIDKNTRQKNIKITSVAENLPSFDQVATEQLSSSRSTPDSTSSKKLLSKSRDGPSIGTEILATILEQVEGPDTVSSKTRRKVEIVSPANAIEEIFARRRNETDSILLSKQSLIVECHGTESSTSEELTPPSSAHLVTYSKSRRRIWASALLRDLRSESEEILMRDSDDIMKTPVASVIRLDSSVKKNDANRKEEEK